MLNARVSIYQPGTHMTLPYLYFDSTTPSRATIPSTFHWLKYALGETSEVTFKSGSDPLSWYVGGDSTWASATG